ncbi:uncharacterized protein BDR25DRAFT_216837 [Lindgomyces ingoldianus]|uniref:Uncharacterized protein n=1 Tax=Lindgomyces ingoldianus TaxID=673940 RepID=A0ACB6R3A1_9PLEO|nr:uncharacterized protein BDR25DRAFT_216837 [Lindgomyces ingoldianus]KAF2473580.1 hypothetical protein BDR25DRAFT_216837 [Lindgomyces ingoldianus]
MVATTVIPAWILQATATRYSDRQKGACGCGLAIAPGFYTAAASRSLSDHYNTSWCGSDCGKCYTLTSISSVTSPTCGASRAASQSIIVMVTNFFLNVGKAQWCPIVEGQNNYRVEYHFDIMVEDMTSEMLGANVIVDFEE